MTTTSTIIKGNELSAFIRRRRPVGGRIYAVADAARDRALAFAARDQFGLTMHSLFSEDAPEEMDRVAPYVVAIDSAAGQAGGSGGTGASDGAGYLDLWAKNLGTSAGILFASPAGMDKLVVQLSNCFRVTNDDGQRYFFRFYDPRVLRTYLPTCTAQDAKEFFGPIGCIFVEAQTDGDMLTCWPTASGVRLDQAPLADRTSAS